MILFAVAANCMLFYSLSWTNKLPRKTPARQQFSAIEVFPVELPPPPSLPVTKAMPTVADKIDLRTEIKTMEFVSEPIEFAPRMADWMPQLPLVRIPLTLRAIEIPYTTKLPKATRPIEPMQLFQVDQVPKKIIGHLPDYPYWARAKGAEGIVILRFVVDVQGKVGKIEIDKLTGDPRFAETAEKAVEKWIFAPATYNTKPVAVWCIQKIQFKLD